MIVLSSLYIHYVLREIDIGWPSKHRYDFAVIRFNEHVELERRNQIFKTNLLLLMFCNFSVVRYKYLVFPQVLYIHKT